MRAITSKQESRLSLDEEIEFNPAGRDRVRPQGSFTLPVQRLRQFMRFCLVGGSGVVVDMGVLHVLADPKTLALNLAFSKVCAAEVALVNNFVWNELWTFQSSGSGAGILPVSSSGKPSHARQAGSLSHYPRLRRFLFFNAICGIGILFAVLLLHLFHTRLGWNLYLSNLLTIVLVTLWNFGMNARFNWRRGELKVSKPIRPMIRTEQTEKLN